jgi:hypothetical protein
VPAILRYFSYSNGNRQVEKSAGTVIEFQPGKYQGKLLRFVSMSTSKSNTLSFERGILLAVLGTLRKPRVSARSSAETTQRLVSLLHNMRLTRNCLTLNSRLMKVPSDLVSDLPRKRNTTLNQYATRSL